MMKAIGYEDAWINCQIQAEQAKMQLGRQKSSYVGSGFRVGSGQKDKDLNAAGTDQNQIQEQPVQGAIT